MHHCGAVRDGNNYHKPSPAAMKYAPFSPVISAVLFVFATTLPPTMPRSANLRLETPYTSRFSSTTTPFYCLPISRIPSPCHAVPAVALTMSIATYAVEKVGNTYSRADLESNTICCYRGFINTLSGKNAKGAGQS